MYALSGCISNHSISDIVISSGSVQGYHVDEGDYWGSVQISSGRSPSVLTLNYIKDKRGALFMDDDDTQWLPHDALRVTALSPTFLCSHPEIQAFWSKCNVKTAVQFKKLDLFWLDDT